MCDPFTIAGVALTGLSAGLNAAAQSQVASARDDAMAAERIRQQGLDQEADAINARSRGRYEDFQGQQTDKASKLTQMFQQPTETPPVVAAAMPASGSNVTVQEIAKKQGEAKDFTNRTAAALGNLRSFGDLLGDTSRLQGRDANLVGQIGGFKKGSSNVLGMELENANSAGSGLSLFADIAGGLGRIGTGMGLSGAGPSFSNLFGSTPTVANGSMAAARALDRASVPGYAGMKFY